MKTKALRENTILHSNLSLKRQDLKDMNTLDKKVTHKKYHDAFALLSLPSTEAS